MLLITAHATRERIVFILRNAAQLGLLASLGMSEQDLLQWVVADLDSSNRADAANALSLLARLALSVDNHTTLANLPV